MKSFTFVLGYCTAFKGHVLAVHSTDSTAYEFMHWHVSSSEPPDPAAAAVLSVIQ